MAYSTHSFMILYEQSTSLELLDGMRDLYDTPTQGGTPIHTLNNYLTVGLVFSVCQGNNRATKRVEDGK